MSVFVTPFMTVNMTTNVSATRFSGKLNISANLALVSSRVEFVLPFMTTSTETMPTGRDKTLPTVSYSGIGRLKATPMTSLPKVSLSGTGSFITGSTTTGTYFLSTTFPMTLVASGRNSLTTVSSLSKLSTPITGHGNFTAASLDMTKQMEFILPFMPVLTSMSSLLLPRTGFSESGSFKAHLSYHLPGATVMGIGRLLATRDIQLSTKSEEVYFLSPVFPMNPVNLTRNN